MSVARADLSFVKSTTVTDTSANGGRMSNTSVQNRTKYNLFPRVTRPERVVGITRYRKEYLWNKNASNETAYGVLIYMIYPSPGDDYFGVAQGSQVDIQSGLTNYDWYGVAALSTAAAPSDDHIHFTFEDDEFFINNGTLLAINSHFLITQTLDTTVKPFDQVYWDGAKWIVQSAPTLDAEDVYPYGTCISESAHVGTVFSYNTNGKLEYHRIADPLVTSNMSTSGGNVWTFQGAGGTFPFNPGSITITYVIGGVTYTAYDDGEGAITGTSISAGTVTYATGAVSISFTVAVTGTPTCEHALKSYTWAGNICTATLEDTILNTFATTNTYVGTCLEVGDIETTITNVVKTFAGSGTLAEAQITGNNRGSIYETWTLTFSSSSAFSCSGAYLGVIGSGTIGTSYAPVNAVQGQPYFTIPSAAWGGTINSGDTVVFVTNPASVPIWWKEVVPVSANPMSNNIAMLEVYVE